MLTRNQATIRILIVMFFCCLFLLSACGGTQARYDKAKTHFNAGEYRPAEIQLKNVLQKEPENAEAWLLLGRVSLATSQYADAVEQLLRAEAKGIDSKTLAVPMARSLLGAGRYDEVIGLMPPDQIGDAKNQAQLWAVKGQAYRALEQDEKAASAFANALEAQADFAPALVGQAELAEKEADTDQAQKLLDKAVAKQPGYAPAYEARGLFAYNHNDCVQAEHAFKQALSKKDEPLPVERQFRARAYLAECQIRQTKYDDAQKIVNRLIEQNASNAYANYLQSLLDIQNKHYDQATTHLQQVLKVAPDNPQALTLLASAKIAQKDTKLAEVYLEQALASAPGDARALRMLAALYMHQDKMPKAIGLLQDARNDNPDNATVRAMLAEAVARGGDAETVLAYARPDTTTGKADQGMQLDLARAMAQKGDTDAALSLLGEIKSDSADEQVQASLLKIRVYLQKGQNDKAIATAQALVAKSPNDPRLMRALAVTQVAAGQDGAARKTLEQALAAAPKDIDTRMGLGLLALRTGDYDSARKRFQNVLSAQPDNLRAMFALARIAREQGDRQAAADWLKKTHDAAPGNQAVAVALIEAYLAAGKSDQALPLTDKLVTDHPDNAELRRLRGAALMGAGKPEQGIKNLRQAAERADDKPEYRLDLARALLSQDKAEDAIDELEKLRKRHPDFVPAIPTLAMAQLRAGQADAALATAAGLSGTESGDVASNTLKGDILGAQGNYAEAAAAYARAYKSEPTRSVAMNLFEARRRAGMDEPQRSLADWVEKNPKDLAARIVLGQWYQQNKHLADAAEQYRAVLAEQPKQLAALNNLALVYNSQNNDKALSVAKQAFDIAPDNPAVIDTLGWITAENGNAERGLKLIRQATSAAPSSQDIQYHLAAVLARRNNRGDRAEAKTILARILKNKDDFESREDAQALSDRLEDGGSAATNARRTLKAA